MFHATSKPGGNKDASIMKKAINIDRQNDFYSKTGNFKIHEKRPKSAAVYNRLPPKTNNNKMELSED